MDGVASVELPAGGEQHRASSPAVQSLLAGIEECWLTSELTLQHARRRIADLVVAQRTMPSDAAEARAGLEQAQRELEAAVDATAIEVESTRDRAATLRSRLDLAESRAALVALGEEMEAANDRIRATLERVTDIVMTHESRAQAASEVADIGDELDGRDG